MSIPCSILKSLLIDLTDYVHLGIDYEDIYEHIEEILESDKKYSQCIPSLISGTMILSITVPSHADDEIYKLGDSILNDLDRLLVDEHYLEKEN